MNPEKKIIDNIIMFRDAFIERFKNWNGTPCAIFFLLFYGGFTVAEEAHQEPYQNEVSAEEDEKGGLEGEINAYNEQEIEKILNTINARSIRKGNFLSGMNEAVNVTDLPLLGYKSLTTFVSA